MLQKFGLISWLVCIFDCLAITILWFPEMQLKYNCGNCGLQATLWLRSCFGFPLIDLTGQTNQNPCKDVSVRDKSLEIKVRQDQEGAIIVISVNMGYRNSAIECNLKRELSKISVNSTEKKDILGNRYFFFGLN